MVIAALALLTCTLVFAPIASPQSGVPTLSPTPPVTLAPPPTTPASTTTTFSAPQLPKTGVETWLTAVGGLGLLAAGAALRRARGGPDSRRSG